MGWLKVLNTASTYPNQRNRVFYPLKNPVSASKTTEILPVFDISAPSPARKIAAWLSRISVNVTYPETELDLRKLAVSITARKNKIISCRVFLGRESAYYLYYKRVYECKTRPPPRQFIFTHLLKTRGISVENSRFFNLSTPVIVIKSFQTVYIGFSVLVAHPTG